LKAWEQVQKSFARKTTKIQGKELFTGKKCPYLLSNHVLLLFLFSLHLTKSLKFFLDEFIYFACVLTDELGNRKEKQNQKLTKMEDK